MSVFTTKQNTFSPSGDKKIRFCSYCGTKLDDGDLFCNNCGEAVIRNNQKIEKDEQPEEFAENPTKRKILYEGSIHKCPSCGEVLEAFVTVCPSCGYEIRDTKSSSSVRELALKLESISAQEMPKREEKRSVLKMVLGSDLKNEETEADEKKAFEKERIQKKASTIANFPIPNTREDILEFLILASSNIDVYADGTDAVANVWLSKFEQVHKKALISMNGSDFEKAQKIYSDKMKEIENAREEMERKKLIRIAVKTAVIIIGAIMIIIGGINDSMSIFLCIGMMVIAGGVVGIPLDDSSNSKNNRK